MKDRWELQEYVSEAIVHGAACSITNRYLCYDGLRVLDLIHSPFDHDGAGAKRLVELLNFLEELHVQDRDQWVSSETVEVG